MTLWQEKKGWQEGYWKGDALQQDEDSELIENYELCEEQLP